MFAGLGWVWVGASNLTRLELLPSAATSRGFLLTLGQKMQRHGSIFTDSCLSAAAWAKPNLASFVAQTVGKGVRVIGSAVSFSKVRVKRFHAYYPQITVRRREQQRVYQEGAKCPSFSASRKPDSEGNCACKEGATCETKNGNPCPSAGGLNSSTKFLPVCGERWALERCACKSAFRRRISKFFR
mmetsp:Transcript_88759/g.246560  ORF Transcript_88759/g.246560 Transcript_88759/m.246560 type:complete len:185 (+) Transcript_88759:1-555(+)